ncbi:undecaprenyl-phosphate glucose phosphotransferase [Methylocystis parvus]|uniref:undecaprenyl-phosphate glucose phosphotransferase n=1 Tax=Methylocystis parvus TaxID=134 RepID=UPI0002E2F693|nr:undecaprenyl-phosphate glucose phosphotransferase [Methylocystis parvus]WBK00266.1 undecaprenyl-phosphate glucose phosphotransferase [Methylocystis parvus OBBP]
MSHQFDYPPDAAHAEPTISRGRRSNENSGRHAQTWSPRRNTALLRLSFSILAAALDFLAIMLAAVVAQLAYHVAAYSWNGLTAANLQPSLIAAAIFLLANAMRQEYSFANYLQLRGHGWRSFGLWTLVCLLALAIGFLTKTTEDTSRAAFVLASAAGIAAILAQRATLCHFVRASAETGGVSARRLFLVGFEQDIKVFTYRYKPWTCGMNVVASVVLRDSEQTLTDDLALAVASARMLRPDDIFILTPWSRTDVIDECVTAFLHMPARIHLGPERVLDRFVDARIDKVGAISSLSLSGHPLNLVEIAAKRVFDIVASATALLLLSPLLLLCGLLIRLESKGPALFLQRRYGFNRETFRIVKFRTMKTMEDDRHMKQATANDPRVTRIGRFLRRYNIDELPQLFNVLRGDMSLVGPRPHAVAHDQLFERRIALYARRHNVKPGITGWAQVNGLRGEIDSPEKIRQRVEHDLYYIDNWSMLFDIAIMFLTVFSRKAYRNAV